MGSPNSFRFFGLPAEIRNEIYRLAFECITTMITRGTTHMPHITNHHTADNQATGVLGLIHANRQLRAEAGLIFYATTRFISTSEDAALIWLKTRDQKQRSAIARLCVRSSIPRPRGYSHLDEACCRQVGVRFTFKLRAAGIDLGRASAMHELWNELDGAKLWPKDSLDMRLETEGTNSQDPDLKSRRDLTSVQHSAQA